MMALLDRLPDRPVPEGQPALLYLWTYVSSVRGEPVLPEPPVGRAVRRRRDGTGRGAVRVRALGGSGLSRPVRPVTRVARAAVVAGTVASLAGTARVVANMRQLLRPRRRRRRARRPGPRAGLGAAAGARRGGARRAPACAPCSPRAGCRTWRSWSSTTGPPTAPPTWCATSPRPTTGSGCCAGADLPPGRLGKPWACAQLAARGRPARVLVFVDADVEVAPGGVAATVLLLRESGLDLVSPVPAPAGAVTVAERLVQPLLQWSWLTSLPLRWRERSARTSLAVADGQLLAVDAGAYRPRPAAHAAVRADVLDDVALLRAVKRGRRARRGRRRHRRRRPAACTTAGRRCATATRSRCGRRSAHRPGAARGGRAARRGGRTCCRRVAALAGRLAGRAGRATRPARRRAGAGRAPRRRPGVAGRAGAPGVGRRVRRGSSVDSVRRHRAGSLTWKGRPAPVSRVVVVGAGMGGLAVAARLAAQGHDGHGARAGRDARRQGRRGSSATASSFDTGPSLLTLPAVYRDLFLKHRARRAATPRSRTTSGSSRSTRRSRTAFADGTRVEVPDASRAGTRERARRRARRRRRRAVDRARRPRRARLEGDARAVPHQPGCRRRAALLRLATNAARPAHGRAVHDAARARPPVPARPAAADDAGPLRHLHRLGPAAGAGGAVRHPVRRADLRGVARARAACASSPTRCARRCVAARCVVPLRRARGSGRASSAAGSTASGCATVSTCRPTSSCRDADARHLYADLLPGAVAGRPRSALDRTTPSSSGFVAAARARRPHAGAAAPHGAVPRRLRRGVRRRVRRGPRGRSPTRPSTSARRTTRACVRTTARGVVRPGQRTAARARRPSQPAGSTGHAATSPQASADRLLASLARRGLDVRDRVRVVDAAHARRPRARQRRHRAAPSTVRRRTVRARRSGVPANVGPVPGLFLVGGSAHPGGGLPLVGISAEIVAGLVGRA